VLLDAYSGRLGGKRPAGALAARAELALAGRLAAPKMGRSHRSSARARKVAAHPAGGVSLGEQTDSDECEGLPITRPSQVQLSSSAVVEYELPAADDSADIWRPGMQHDEHLDHHLGHSHPGCRPSESRYGRSQVKVNWARLNAILGSESSPPAKRVDRASGPDAPPEVPAHRRTTAQGSPWYLLGGTALFGVGCALGYGLALSAGSGNDSCALSSSGAPQVPAPELQMHATADSLRQCRSDLLGEQNERSRAETAVEQCEVQRTNLLEQLHYMATEMLKPSR
jgi:hypothetical protein